MTIDEQIDIDIGSKTLAYSLRQVPKLNSDEGCLLNHAPERTYRLTDSELSSDDEDVKNFESQNNHSTTTFVATLPHEDKIERMKREFISLTTNSNKDPLNGESVQRLQKLLFKKEDNTDEENTVDESYNCDILIDGLDNYQLLKDDHNIIHKRFDKSKEDSFLKLIRDGESFPNEISENRVYKRVIHPGTGSVITESSMIIYNCACWTEKSEEPYDSTWLRKSTYITDLSIDSVLPGIKELILSMRKQEWCEAMILPEAAFGPLGCAPRIPANAIIYCVIEMVNVISKDKMSILAYNPRAAQESGLKFDDFYLAGNEARMRGNYFYENKQFKIAMIRYKSGIRILEALTFKDETEEKKANELLLKLYSNCAKSANELGKPRLALAMCKQGSMIDDLNPKIFWHRMRAWKLKGHVDLSLKVARRAISLFKHDRQYLKYFESEERKLRALITKEIHEHNNLYRLMGRAVINS